MSEIIGNLVALGIDVRADGPHQQKVKCPKCSTDRRDKRDKSLSVNINTGGFRCHYCAFTGFAVENEDDKKYERPTVEEEKYLEDSTLSFFKERGISKTTVVASKITDGDEWMPKEDGVVPVVKFNYWQGGRLINIKYRSLSKSFKLHKGAKLIFYGIDNIIGQEDVIITEGEMDYLSFFEAGFNNVISVPNGANKGLQKLEYLDNCINFFDSVERIYVAVDGDDAGESLFQELTRRLGKDRCFRVHYPGECKDANEVLMLHDIEGVKQLISGATPLPIEGIVDFKEERESILALYHSGIERGEELEAFGPKFDTLCTFQTGKLYTITGIPSHGKSNFLQDIETVLAAKKGWKIGVFSPEHFPLKYMAYKYAEFITGKPFFEGDSDRMSLMELDKALEFVEKNFFFIRPKGEMFTLDNILDKAANLVSRYGIKALTIDPWNTIAHDFNGKSETQYIEEALNKITLFKQEKDVAIFLVAHPKKMQKEQTGDRRGQYEVPNLYDISGSSNFFNKTDVGISVYRDFNTGLTSVYIQKMKYRNLGEVGICTFKYNKLNNRFEWAEAADDGTNTIRLLQSRSDSLIKEEFEQLEIGNAVAPNTEFEIEADDMEDDLPF